MTEGSSDFGVTDLNSPSTYHTVVQEPCGAQTMRYDRPTYIHRERPITSELYIRTAQLSPIYLPPDAPFYAPSSFSPTFLYRNSALSLAFL